MTGALRMMTMDFSFPRATNASRMMLRMCTKCPARCMDVESWQDCERSLHVSALQNYKDGGLYCTASALNAHVHHSV